MKQVLDAAQRASGSVKAWAALATAAVNILAPTLGLTLEQTESITQIGLVLIGGIGVADFGKAAQRERIQEAREVRKELADACRYGDVHRARAAEVALKALLGQRARTPEPVPTTPAQEEP